MNADFAVIAHYPNAKLTCETNDLSILFGYLHRFNQLFLCAILILKGQLKLDCVIEKIDDVAVFAKNIVLWLAALSSISWFVLAGGYIYALANKWESVSLKNSVYKMKPIASKEATFFHCLFAIIFIALGVVLAIVFFREWLLA